MKPEFLLMLGLYFSRVWTETAAYFSGNWTAMLEVQAICRRQPIESR